MVKNKLILINLIFSIDIFITSYLKLLIIIYNIYSAVQNINRLHDNDFKTSVYVRASLNHVQMLHRDVTCKDKIYI